MEGAGVAAAMPAVVAATWSFERGRRPRTREVVRRGGLFTHWHKCYRGRSPPACAGGALPSGGRSLGPACC